MSDIPSNIDDPEDFSRAKPQEPDPYGQAALLLAESILHSLIDAHILTLVQASEAVRVACEVKVDVADDTGESSDRMRQSLNLLAAIERSLGSDRAGPANEP